jgi:hypothetical protein
VPRNQKERLVNDRSSRGRPARPSPARTRRRRPQLAGLVGALALTLAVAACANNDKTGGVASLSGSDSPTATTNAGGARDRKQAALDFSRCMREHGINMPDPKFDANGNMTLTIKAGPGAPKPDDQKFKAAQRACQKYLPNGGKPTNPDPQQVQRALQFARCMRAHGIDVPDPQPGGGITVRGSSGGSSTGKGPNPDDPKFKQAQQACQHFLGGKGGTFTQSGGDDR